jgi:hypothetical protein
VKLLELIKRFFVDKIVIIMIAINKNVKKKYLEIYFETEKNLPDYNFKICRESYRKFKRAVRRFLWNKLCG